VKLAVEYGVEELLPPGRKSTEYRNVKLVEKGLRVRGTGVGQKVKGHKWERTMKIKLEERKKAMLGMPEMIRLWKQVMLCPNCGVSFLPFFGAFSVLFHSSL
jgi:large subunit ribosomal protein L25